MSKRRTKIQKTQAKHPFVYQWSSAKPETPSEPVKRQFNLNSKTLPIQTKASKSANTLDKDGNLGIIKTNIIKSLILASLILGLEVVLYLFRI